MAECIFLKEALRTVSRWPFCLPLGLEGDTYPEVLEALELSRDGHGGSLPCVIGHLKSDIVNFSFFPLVVTWGSSPMIGLFCPQVKNQWKCAILSRYYLEFNSPSSHCTSSWLWQMLPVRAGILINVPCTQLPGSKQILSKYISHRPLGWALSLAPCRLWVWLLAECKCLPAASLGAATSETLEEVRVIDVCNDLTIFRRSCHVQSQLCPFPSQTQSVPGIRSLKSGPSSPWCRYRQPPSKLLLSGSCTDSVFTNPCLLQFSTGRTEEIVDKPRAENSVLALAGSIPLLK